MSDKAPGIPEGLNDQPVEGLPGLESDAEPEFQPREGEPEGEPVKRRRKRGPRKAKTAPVTGEVSDPEKDARETKDLATALGASFQMTGNLVAGFRGDHWKVSDKESEQLGYAWAVALKPYMAAMAPYLAFITAGVVTVGVFAPKVAKDRELRQARPRPLQLSPSIDGPNIPRAPLGPMRSIDDIESPETPVADDGVRSTPEPDAPHLAVEGGFLPPDAIETNKPAARRRR